jgi:methanogenic corrinoid protein MtbC1/DNA-binding XRE family transcriptional regulator
MKSFADRLKHLRKQKGLTQKQLGEALGIGQTAIANYEQGNRNPDGEGLMRIAEILEVSVDALLGREDPSARPHGDNSSYDQMGQAAAAMTHLETDPELRGDDPPLDKYRSESEVDSDWERDKYIELVLSGLPVVAINRVNELAVLGVPVNRLYREILEPVLIRTGEMWAEGRMAIHQEHAVSQSIISCMGLLRAFMKRKPSNGKRFLGVVVNGEMHGIGLMMVCDYMHMEGWDVMYLGTYLPGPEAAGAIKTYRPEVVGLSVTMTYNIHSAEMLISILKDDDAEKKPLILVGGQVFSADPELWQKIGADAFARKGVEAVAMLDRLIK